MPHSDLVFIGLDTHYETAEGKSLPRLHLDGAASPLAAQIALDSLSEFLPHYSNSHSLVHQSAKISTQALTWAHSQVLKFLNLSDERHSAIFIGAGTTAAINRIARGFAQSMPHKKSVLVSAMEHHANDLPHRQFGNEVIYAPLEGEGPNQGQISISAVEDILKSQSEVIGYFTFSAVSNITGIINPVSKLIHLAHEYQIPVLVDAAQGIAHATFSDGSLKEADYIVFSGHKVYCPTAPGVLVCKNQSLQHLPGQDLGGGAVSDVSYFDHQLHDQLIYREQAGTPNIAGAITLARVLEALDDYGVRRIANHSKKLIEKAMKEFSKLEFIQVYGDRSSQRTGALAFNHKNIDHGLFAAILNDYYMIAVRNECFCAQPYASSLLKHELWEIELDEIPESDLQSYLNRKRGMVRASFSLYNTLEDIDRIIEAVIDIDARIEFFQSQYHALEDGNYQHKEFKLHWRKELGW